MKKFLLLLIVSIAFTGSIFAQYESHWPAVVMGEDQAGLCASIAIDGHVYTVDDEGWDALELAAYVDNVLRGKAFLNRENVDNYNDPYPITNGTAIQYENIGDPVSFKLYNHLTNTEYEIWESTYQGNPITILTGYDHMEAWLDEPYDPIILNFTTPSTGITMDINGYGDSENGNYYLLASPVGEVAPADVTNMTENDYDLYSFDHDEFMEEWQANPTSLVPGVGYLYANSNTVVLTFPGTAFDTDNDVDAEGLQYNVTITKNEDLDLGAWNLIGNPYNENVTINKSYYRLNEARDAVLGDVQSNEINPMEGVFVKADSDEEVVTFTTVPSGKKVSTLVMNVLKNRGIIADRAIVTFTETEQLPKFQLRQNSTKIYIPQEGKDFAIVNAGEMGEMPVNFKAENNGSYTLSFNNTNVTFNYLHLIDNMTGEDVDLLVNPSYTFDATTTDYESRFKLIFAADDTNEADNFGFVSNGHLMIYGIEGEAILKVIDITGRTIATESFSDSYDKALGFSSGVYLIQLIQGTNVRTQKIVL